MTRSDLKVVILLSAAVLAVVASVAAPRDGARAPEAGSGASEMAPRFPTTLVDGADGADPK